MGGTAPLMLLTCALWRHHDEIGESGNQIGIPLNIQRLLSRGVLPIMRYGNMGSMKLSQY